MNTTRGEMLAKKIGFEQNNKKNSSFSFVFKATGIILMYVGLNFT
jgi:hypothetical protein